MPTKSLEQRTRTARQNKDAIQLAAFPPFTIGTLAKVLGAGSNLEIRFPTNTYNASTQARCGHDATGDVFTLKSKELVLVSDARSSTSLTLLFRVEYRPVNWLYYFENRENYRRISDR